jgi:hypothetical protein
LGEYDCTEVVTRLAYAAAQELGVADAPASRAEMRDVVEQWIKAASATASATAETTDFDGIGIGIEALSIVGVLTIVVEALLGTSLHVGLMHVHEAIRQRLNQPAATQSDSPDLRSLLGHSDAFRDELYRRLLSVGVPDEQARYTADLVAATLLHRPDRRG